MRLSEYREVRIKPSIHPHQFILAYLAIDSYTYIDGYVKPYWPPPIG